MKSVEPPETRKPTSLRRKLAMLGLALFCSLLLTELGLRIVWHNPYRDETPDHVLVLPIHHPGRHFIFSRPGMSTGPSLVHFRLDDRGYIRPSHQFNNPDITIAFVGGSTTECYAVDEPLRFPALVSTLLAKRGLRVNTLNAGHAKNTTHDALNIFLNHLIEDRPDVVIFMEAWSDHRFLSRDGSYRSAMGAPASFSSTMRWPLEKVSSVFHLAGLLRLGWATYRVAPDAIEQGGDSDVRSRKIPPVEEFARHLRAFVRVSKAFGITPALMTQPVANWGDKLTRSQVDLEAQVIFNDATRKVAGEEEVLLIDLARHFTKDVPGWDEPMAYFDDGIHVTDRGSQEEAAYITQRLAETILAPKLASKQSRPAAESHPESDGKRATGREATLVEH